MPCYRHRALASTHTHTHTHARARTAHTHALICTAHPLTRAHIFLPFAGRYAKNFTQCGSKAIAAPTAASALTLRGLRAGAVTAAVFYNTTTGAPLPLAAGGSATLANGALVIVFPDFLEDAAAYVTMA